MRSSPGLCGLGRPTVLALYRVMCGLLQVICGLGRPMQSDVRSCQGDVRDSYAHKFVMCGDVWCAVMCGFQALRTDGLFKYRHTEQPNPNPNLNRNTNPNHKP